MKSNEGHFKPYAALAAGCLREIRLVVPECRDRSVRQRIARQVARLRHTAEDDALHWIEAVSEFDAPDRDEAR